MIRAAEVKDLPVIVELMNETILHSTAIYDYNARTEEYVMNWFTKKQSEGMPVVVCEVDGNSVGFASYGIFRAWDAYKYSAEHSLYVKKDFQARGLGKQLLLELLRIAKQKQFHTMIAGIDALNTGSIEFHRKLGFVEVGTFREVGYKFNKWLDLVFMQYFID
jgi:L-amino acid N-acyltransferase